MSKKSKIILFSILGLVAAISLAVAVPFVVMGIKTNKLNKDYTYLKEDASYSKK